MSIQAVLLPVFALVFLLFLLLVRMAAARYRAVASGAVKLRDIALGQSAWPAPIQQTSNAYSNNLQLPLLFYALVAFALITKKADLLFVALSWLFVTTRYVHAYIHVTSNSVPRRFQAFGAGVFTLALMWLIFAIRILAAL